MTTGPLPEAETLSGRVQRVWDVSQELAARCPEGTRPDDDVLDQAIELFEELAGFIAAGWDVAADVPGLLTVAQVLLLLGQAREDPSFAAAAARLIDASQALSAGKLPQQDRETVAALSAPGTAWSILAQALLGLAEDLQRPGLLDAAVVACRRAVTDAGLADAERPIALQNLGFAVLGVYVRDGTAELREQLVAAVMGVPETAPAHTAICLLAATSLLQWGETQADLAAHIAGEEIVLRALATQPATQHEMQFLLLLRALRCHRALLADPDLAADLERSDFDGPPPPEGDTEAALLAGYRAMTVVMPRAFEANFANTMSPPSSPTLAGLGEAVGALHWQRFREARLAADENADLMADVEIDVLAYDGEERIDIALRLPSDPAAELDLNDAVAMYALTAVERPDAVPSAIRSPCQVVVDSGNGLASMGADRAIALLDANDQEPDPDGVRAAIGKLTRTATSPYVTPGWRDLLAALLGDALIRLYQVDRDPATLERALAILRRAANCGREHRGRSRRSLAEALDLRRQLGEADLLLGEIVDQLRSLVASPDVESRDRLNLASALSRSEPEASDLDELIDQLREVVTAADLESDHQRTAHTMLAEALMEVYDANEDLMTLEEVIEQDRAALALSPPGSVERRTALDELARRLHTRFEHSSDLAALEEALSISTQACEGLDPTRKADAVVLLSHANIVASMSEETNAAGSLTAVLPLLRAAVTAHAQTPYLLLRLLDKLALVLHQLWEVGEPVDLDEALDAARRAVELAPAEPDSAGFFGNLGYLLLSAYAARGERNLLDESIARLREATELSRDALDLRLAQVNLAGGLIRRHVDRGDTPALREAIDLARAAADSEPTRSEHPIALSNLGGALIQLYASEPEAADLLGEAVQVLRESVELSQGHHRHEGHLLNLGQALNTLSRVRQDPAMREQSLELGAAAVASLPLGHVLRPKFQLAHAELLLGQQDGSGGAEATQQGLDLLFEIVRSEASGQVLAAAQRRIGDLLMRIAWEREDPEINRQAIPYLRTAAKTTTATAHLRASAARSWGLAAARDGEFAEALEALTLVIEIVDGAAAGDLEPADQERWLGSFRGVARLAAACAIELGEPAVAVELLERGRGVLLGRTLSARRQVRRLREVAPELADALDRVEAAVAELASTSYEVADPIALSARNARRVQLEDERQTLLARIHQLPGLEELGRPPRMESLQAAAAAGPIVIVNVSRLRCDALIVGQDGARVLPLPSLDESDLEERAELFVGAVEILGRDDGVELSFALAARRVVFATLEWLWVAVAEPVLESLGIDGPSPHPPRLWWCPTGDLNFLPLHAAGRHRASGQSDTALDRIVSSYTPTLRSLTEAVDAGEVADDVALMVAVSESRHAALPRLDVDRDIEAFAALFPDEQILRDEAATAERVLTALREATVVHIAGHAHQDFGDPSAGCIDLWDRQVTVAELRGAIGRPGRLALLLGCATARGGRRLADESISLVGALQHAGFQHGVGSMWPIDDGDSERVALAVYAADAPAQAVADAVRALRDERPMAPNRWAGLIHVGP